MLKKIILSATSAILLSSSFSLLSAYSICDSEVNLNKSFKPDKNWMSFKNNLYGVSYTTYKKNKGKTSCQVIVNSDKKILKFSKKIKVGKPTLPGKKLFGADFKYGNFYGKDMYANPAFEVEGSNFENFVTEVKAHIQWTRTITSIYDNKDFTSKNNVMCMGYGNTCFSVLTVENKSLNQPISPLGSSKFQTPAVKRGVPITEKSYFSKEKLPNLEH